MPDIIQLLPDSVANQIAAGEVIQRPASAVKELIENSIDAGATSVRLILKEAGKQLIQVIDNGCGMSETDARMSFERHATSKIRKAEDLFSIRTMGFRGEALASVAAIAQVELKTKRQEDETGTHLLIEGSTVISQEACSTANGTSIVIKNLFYNIPARRNFLKSNPVELRHIIDEFQRITLAHSDKFFSLHHDEQELFHLVPANLKQRIIHLFGNNYGERLVPLEEQTTIVAIKGFIGKPEYAKKARGEQFFFVNNRFIKDPYLNHAVLNAYTGLLSEGSFPLYALFIDIEPAKIDVNVHPTKTEIKFDDEKIIYAMIRSAAKNSLGKYNIVPSLDFNQDTELANIPALPKGTLPQQPTITINPDYNPFKKEKQTEVNFPFRRENLKNWQTLYEIAQDTHQQETQQLSLSGRTGTVSKSTEEGIAISEKLTFQLHKRYILTQIKSGLMLIDQQAAHERILYERFYTLLEKHQGSSQQCLFPQSVELNASDFSLARELDHDLKALGFDIRELGKNTIVVYGIPADIEGGNEVQMIEGLLENYKQNLSLLKLDKREALARSLARNSATKAGKILTKEEMNTLIDDLFACQMPSISPGGKPALITMTLEELSKKFGA